MARSTAVNLRYIFQALHVSFSLAIFFTSLFAAFNIIYTCVQGAAILALLIYIPASIILTAKDSTSSFQHAGGEVAYLVVQMAAWLVSGIWAVIVRALYWQCVDGVYRRGVRYVPTYCNTAIIIAVLSFIHFILLTIWMSWLAHAAHHTPGRGADEAFKLPAHHLLAGNVAGAGMGYRNEMSMESGAAVDPYTVQHRASAPLMTPAGVPSYEPKTTASSQGGGEALSTQTSATQSWTPPTGDRKVPM